MKNQIKITSLTSSLDVSNWLAEATRASATHVHILKAGGKRALVVPIEDAPENCLGIEATVTVGNKAPGLPFEPLPDTDAGPTEPVKIVKADPTKPAALKPHVRQTREVPPVAPESRQRGSGYIAYIDQLLLEVDGKGADEKGFLRSKYTVTDAVRAVLMKFPGKNPGSVKRVVKVRPRHLERAKTLDRFSESGDRAPRWAWTGPGSGTGFMRRVDELLVQGKHTTREIAEISAREFGRDVESALLMVQTRPNFLRRKRNIKASAKPMPKQISKREITKAKNLELLNRRISKKLGLS